MIPTDDASSLSFPSRVSLLLPLFTIAAPRKAPLSGYVPPPPNAFILFHADLVRQNPKHSSKASRLMNQARDVSSTQCTQADDALSSTQQRARTHAYDAWLISPCTHDASSPRKHDCTRRQRRRARTHGRRRPSSPRMHDAVVDASSTQRHARTQTTRRHHPTPSSTHHQPNAMHARGRRVVTTQVHLPTARTVASHL
jgi:hypothetical protein